MKTAYKSAYRRNVVKKEHYRADFFGNVGNLSLVIVSTRIGSACAAVSPVLRPHPPHHPLLDCACLEAAAFPSLKCGADAMPSSRLILVIDQSCDRAAGLKELIEFMDAPDVRTATPRDWRDRLGPHRLAAIFVNEQLPQEDMSGLLDNIGKLDPNVPIVLVNGVH